MAQTKIQTPFLPDEESAQCAEEVVSTSHDKEQCTFQDLTDTFATLQQDFENLFIMFRTKERAWAKEFLGPGACDPVLISHEVYEDVTRVLCEKPMLKLQTFGYRMSRPNTMHYWLEKRGRIPDLSIVNGSIDTETLPNELINHIYVHYVLSKKKEAAATRMRLRGGASSSIRKAH